MKFEKINSILLFLFCFFSVNGFSLNRDSLLGVANGSDDDLSKISALYELYAEEIEVNNEAAFQYVNDGIDLAVKVGESNAIAKGYLLRSNYYYYYLQDFELSLQDALLSNSYFKQKDETKDRLKVLSVLGVIYAQTGKEYQALEIFGEIVELSIVNRDTAELRKAYNNYGGVYQVLGFLDQAELYYKKAQKISTLLDNDERFLMTIFINLGELELTRSNHKKAKDYFFKTLKIKKKSAFLFELAYTYSDLGLCYTALSQFDSAKFFLDKAKLINQDFKNELNELRTDYCLANYYNALSEYETAIEFGELSLGRAREMGLLKNEREVLLNLYQSYNGLKIFDKALEYHLNYVQINDSIRKSSERFSVQQIKAQFEFESKIEGIQLFNSYNSKTVDGVWKKDWFVILIFIILMGILVFVLEIRKRADIKKGDNDHQNIDYLFSTRVLYLITAIFYTALPMTIPLLVKGLYDPLYVRAVISFSIFTVYSGTFLSAWIRKNMDSITKFLFLVLLGHHYVLIYINEIPVEQTFYLLIILGGSSVVFKKIVPMAIFTAFSILITVIITFSVEEPILESNIFIAVVSSFLLISLVVSLSKKDLDRHLEFSNEVVTQADALVFIVDRKGDNIYTSQSVKNILGQDPQEFREQDWVSKLGVSTKDAIRIKHNLILIAMGTIEPSFNPYSEFKTKSGETKWLSIREKRMSNDRVLVIGVDVTENKKIQDELVESELNFRQINETLSDVFYLYSFEMEKFEYVSPNSGMLIGAQPEFFYNGRNYFNEYVLEEDQELVRDTREVILNGHSTDLEYRILLEGEIRWIREKSFPVLGESGNVIKRSGLCQDVTERKKAEQEIQKLSLIASNTDNFILMVNNENRVEWANQSFYNLTKYKESETLGKLPLELISGPLTEESRIDDISQAVFGDKKQMQCQMINYKKNKDIFYSSLEVTPIVDENGDLEKYFVIGTDITQRIIDQGQIEQLSMVASNTSNYVVIANEADGIEWVNQAFTEMFGYTLNDVKGKYLVDILHDKEIQTNKIKEINRIVFTEKKKFVGELLHRKKSGEEVYANVNITPIISENRHSAIKYFVLGFDISERKKYELEIEKANLELSIKQKELNESEQNFRQLISSIKEVFWLLDIKSNEFLFVSESYKDVFGRTVDSLVEQTEHWTDVIHPLDQEKVFRSFVRNSKNGTFNEDFRLLLDSGELKWVNARTFPIYNENNEVVKLSGFTEDITVKKQQELRISKIADQLDIVHAIEKTILTSESTEDIIYNTLSKTLDKLPVLRASLALFKTEENTFFAFSKTRDKMTSKTNRKEFSLDDFSMYNTLLEERVILVQNLIKKENKSLTDEILIEEGAVIAMLAPLFHGDKLIGSLNVCFAEEQLENEEHYRVITNEVANGLAIAIKQSQLKDELRRSNNSITASIDYAKMIQQAYIPDNVSIDGCFEESIVINRPKDIVSGDFYWVGQFGDAKVVAVGDCTGHGVPGSFMTIIGISELNNIVNQRGIVDPAEILKALNIAIVKALSTNAEVQLKDGMDIGVFCFDKKTGKANYAGARRPLYRVSKGELEITDGAKRSVGDIGDDFGVEFITYEIKINKEDVFYIFSDGCTDQFGGERIRKFSRKRLETIILDNANQPLKEQGNAIEQALLDWQGNHYQTDDILFLGFKVGV